MQHVTASDLLPQSVAQSTEMIQAHETAVREVFEDETLLVLQSDGPSIISSLKREEEFFSHSQDYRFSMEQVEDIHHHLQDSITRLARLADTRMNKLHNCLQLREYEEECHKVSTQQQGTGE
nr:puratrophin-1-like isoform X2 [Biomphalaria glabrata]